MKKLGRKLTAGESTIVAVLMLCMVLAVAVTAARIASRTKNEDQNQFVELEQTDDTSDTASLEEQEENSQMTTGESVKSEGTPDKFVADDPADEMDMIAMEDQTEIPDMEEAEENGDAEEQSEAVAAPVAETVKAAAVLNFQSTDRLLWPISGNVVLDFSMDGSIYFPTLKQYKYNPAIVISGEEGTEVVAAAAGRVLSVEVLSETGTTVIMDLGNGYTAVYGQLKEVPLAKGDVVSRNDVIGYVSSPTKYYSVEGSNLYFALQKDGAAIDPLDYFE